MTKNPTSLDTITLDHSVETDGPNGSENVRPVATALIDINTRAIISFHISVPKPNDEKPSLKR